MMQAIQRHDRGEANVVPVLLRPVVFTGAPFAKLQPLPTNGKPVVSWRSRDSAFVDIALGIERVVQKRRASLEALLEPPIPLKDPLHLKALPEPEATSYLRPHPVANLPTIGVRSTRQPSWRNRRGPILVALSLLGLVFAGLLLVQHPNLIPLVGGTVEGLILLTVIFLVIRALVRRVQYRNTQRREQEESRRRELEEVQRRGRERAYYEKALTAYEQALLQNNSDAIAYRGKGNALVGLERYGKALTAYEQALALAPLPVMYVSKGYVLTALRRYDEAVATYEQALALDTSYASAYAGMSKALSWLGRTQEAEQAYQRAKELGDED